MTRILVHAGFHRTGTTALQSFLRDNRAALMPYARIHMGVRLGEARRAGRLYGERPGRARRAAFQAAMAEFAASLPDARAHVISRESLSGAMPGARRGLRVIRQYLPQAAELAQDVITALHDRFPGARITLLYTLRGRQDWLRSLYGHRLRTAGLTQGFEDFAAGFSEAPSLRAEAESLRAAVRGAHVITSDLGAGGRLGHGTAVLDWLSVPEAQRAAFTPGTQRHAGPSLAQCAALLDLNRARAPDLRARKAAVMRGTA